MVVVIQPNGAQIDRINIFTLDHHLIAQDDPRRAKFIKHAQKLLAKLVRPNHFSSRHWIAGALPHPCSKFQPLLSLSRLSMHLWTLQQTAWLLTISTRAYRQP